MEKYLQREWVKIKDTIFLMSTTSIDWVTWMNSYQMGIRKPRYPVPTHHYLTMITPHCVEMVTGITKEFIEGEVIFDCVCVFYATNYEVDDAPGIDRWK